MATATEKLKYVQLANHLRECILSGELKEGDRLPSYAEMYQKYGATTATMQRVCSLLEQENLIERRRRSGIYVATRGKSLTGNIGLLIHSHHWGIAGDLSSQSMLAGIRQVCHTNQKEILLIDDAEAIQPTKIDGILIYSDKLEIYAMGIPPQIPQVSLLQRTEGISSVITDDFGAGKLATSYLIKKGHRRIACLMEELLDEPLQRSAGYRAALREAEIDINPSWTKQSKKIEISPSFSYLEWGRQQMQAWLKEGWEQLRCTAIVVQNDHAAIGVMQVLQEEGIKVPEDVSVIGFDGTRTCDLVQPRLTSIKVPYYEMGFEAVKVLLAQVEEGVGAPHSITLPVRLRDGNSVKNLV